MAAQILVLSSKECVVSQQPSRRQQGPHKQRHSCLKVHEDIWARISSKVRLKYELMVEK